MPFSVGAAAADDSDGFKISSPRAEEQSRNVAALFSSLRRMEREREGKGGDGGGLESWNASSLLHPGWMGHGRHFRRSGLSFSPYHHLSSPALRRLRRFFPANFSLCSVFRWWKIVERGGLIITGGVRFEKGRMDELNGWMRFRNFVYKFISYVNFIFWQGNENVQWSKKRI